MTRHYPWDAQFPVLCLRNLVVFLHWVLSHKAASNEIVHFLDDFAFFGRAGTLEAQKLLDSFHEICRELGVPLAKEKTVSPTTNITYLGLQIDSVLQQVQVPEEKRVKALSSIQKIMQSNKVTLHSIQSLTGSLNFLCRAIPPGRAFLRRLIDSTVGIPSKAKHFRIRVTNEMKQDLQVWQQFLLSFQGAAIFLDRKWVSSDTLQLFTDAAGSIGFGIYFQGHWVQHRWPDRFKTYSIAFLELFPVFVACNLWGKFFFL